MNTYEVEVNFGSSNICYTINAKNEDDAIDKAFERANEDLMIGEVNMVDKYED